MKKREVFEFSAEQDENGIFVCHQETVMKIPQQQDQKSGLDLDASSALREKYGDINEIFHRSYQSNYSLKNNELLFEAQDRLQRMQKKILDSIKSI
jgi:hypothetical protein